MTQHLIDTRPTLGRCVRCGAWVLTALVSGGWVGVNTSPLGVVELRALLASGERPYRLRTAAGQAQALTVASLGDVRAGTPVLGPHRCGGHPMDAQAFREAAQDPPQPPVSATGRPAPPYASQGARNRSPAPPVTRHRSRKRHPYINRQCEVCHELIGRSIDYMGMQIGERWVWLQHDWDCRTQKKEGRK